MEVNIKRENYQKLSKYIKIIKYLKIVENSQQEKPQKAWKQDGSNKRESKPLA